MKSSRILCLPSLCLLLLASVVAPLAQAQPANNDWANRELITLPFSDSEAAVSSATIEATDPQQICRVGTSGLQGGNSVWYTYTSGATVEYLTLSTATSGYDTILSVYTGAPTNFSLVAGGCNDDGVAGVFQSRISGLRLAPNTEYSVEVVAFTSASAGNTLNFSVSSSPQYLVSKTADTADGVCNADCSLREAISVSNTTPGAVIVPAGTYTLTLAGTGENNNATGDLDVRAGMGIYGAGSATTVIDAGDLDRVIEVDSATASNRVTFILSDITLTNGTLAAGDGSGLLLAAANDFLAIDNAIIRDNVSTILNGGGVRSASRGTIWNSTISGNSAGSNGGGISLSGGLDATFEVRNSTISGNQSLSGSSTGGGGIHSTTRLRVINSTISGNAARFSGGGVIGTASGSVVVQSSTIVNNTSDSDINNSGTGGGIRLESSSALSGITNSVIANNVDNNTTPAADCSRSAGTINTSFNHVEAPATCTFTGTGDVTGTEPAIAAVLANNGGSTSTHATTLGSALIDAGNPAGCADYLGRAITFDQRGAGFLRAVDGNSDASAICDKGAYEFSPIVVAAPGVPDLDAASDSGVSVGDDLTRVSLPTFTGSCPVDGHTITILVDGTPAAATGTCTVGAYSITLVAEPAEGARSITATASSMSMTSVPSSALLVTFDRTPPVALSIDGPVSPAAPGPTITGTGAEANGFILEVLRLGVTICNGVTATAPTWSCTVTTALVTPGTYLVYARLIDPAGNLGVSSPSYEIVISDVLFANQFE